MRHATYCLLVSPKVPSNSPGTTQQASWHRAAGGWGLGQSSVISLGGSVSRFSRALSRFSTCTATTRHSSRPCRRDGERPNTSQLSPGVRCGRERGERWRPASGGTSGPHPHPHLPRALGGPRAARRRNARLQVGRGEPGGKQCTCQLCCMWPV